MNDLKILYLDKKNQEYSMMMVDQMNIDRIIYQCEKSKISLGLTDISA